MRFGIEIIPFGDLADPCQVLELACAADEAGWEGLWLWDHLLMPYGSGDPWVMLAAAASRTRHLKLIPGVAALPRYLPQNLARFLTGLDLLSRGRVVLGAGLGGVDEEFSLFGGPGEPRERAAMLDEQLEILTSLWTGEEVTYTGRHFRVEGAALRPVPVQQPRIPVWIGGESPAALIRAARWDGWIIGVIDENSTISHPPVWLAEKLQSIKALRGGLEGFEVAVDGISQPGENATARAYAGAGATWWFESLFLMRASYEDLLARVMAGPPVLS